MAGTQPALNTGISGILTTQQQRAIRLARGLVGLFVASSGLVILELIFRLGSIRPGNALQVLVIAAVTALAALATRYQLRLDARTIVEFGCNRSSLWFRRLGKTQPETQLLSDIVTIGFWSSRKGPTGYDLLFRDGTQAHVRNNMSNVDALVERLRPYCQSVQDYSDSHTGPADPLALI